MEMNVVCIVGVNILMNKCVVIVFQYIYGIGVKFVQEIIEKINIDVVCCVNEFFDVEVLQICEIIDCDYFVEGDFCCEIVMNIKCFMDFGCYCGLCYCCGFLVCGQWMYMNVCICKGLVKLIVGKKK